MRPLVVLAAALLPAAALAYESEPQDLLFADSYDVFSAVEYDTDWVPSGSPVQVRFYINSAGAAYTEMEAVSSLTWPEALTQRVDGIPGTGWFALLTDLQIAAQVRYDVFGYSQTIDIWSEDIEMAEDVTFDPLLLEGSPVTEVDVSTRAEDYPPISYPWAVGAGVSVIFELEYFPQARAQLTGIRLETGEAVLYYEGEEILLEVPEENPGWIDLSSVYFAWIDAGLDIVLKPNIEIGTPIGDYELIAFEIPIELASVDEERAFPRVDYTHPLPALANAATSFDFGEVAVDNFSNEQMEFENIGLLDLEGWVSIEGSEAFSVYPEYLHATEGNIDGLVVTFAPTEAGTVSAMLRVESNDPMRPSIEVPLTGTGYKPDYPCGSGEQEAEVTSCGCASGSAPLTGAWMLLGAVVVGLRRRRR